jgi:cytoskeletal protein CcmA (bactofilin family)
MAERSDLRPRVEHGARDTLVVSTIPASVHIIGDLHSEDDLLIEGQVRGNITASAATLTIGHQGRIDGDIRAKRIHIHGAASGAVSASERIDIAATGSVSGNLSADYVVIEDGASVNGHVDMNRRTIAARVARHQASDM